MVLTCRLIFIKIIGSSCDKNQENYSCHWVDLGANLGLYGNIDDDVMAAKLIVKQLKDVGKMLSQQLPI